MTLDQPVASEPALARLVADAEVGGGTPDDDLPLYAPRRKIYPQSAHGKFRNIKWAVLIVTLAIYYLLPFVRWDRGPIAPSQAVLIDFLFLLHRDLAARDLLSHWPAHSRCDLAVPDERGGWPHMVWLSLPADRLD